MAEFEKLESKNKTYFFPSREMPNGSHEFTHSSKYIGLAIKCLCEILIDIKDILEKLTEEI